MRAMAELDRVREQIAYLKYWQGFMIVTDISLVGWMTTVIDNPPWRSFVMALIAVGAISYGILDLHRRIERRIDRVGDLEWPKLLLEL